MCCGILEFAEVNVVDMTLAYILMQIILRSVYKFIVRISMLCKKLLLNLHM